jgi:hypothetical protein
MKIRTQSAVWVLVSTLFLVSFAAAQDKPGDPEYTWLNGKWSGQPPAGGDLQMTLRVENGNQIKGEGLVPGGGRRSAVHPFITGAVIENKVTLDTNFPMRQSNVHYDCTYKDAVLQCRTRTGYETTFKKLE